MIEDSWTGRQRNDILLTRVYKLVIKIKYCLLRSERAGWECDGNDGALPSRRDVQIGLVHVTDKQRHPWWVFISQRVSCGPYTSWESGNLISSVSFSSLLAGVFSIQLCSGALTFSDNTQSPWNSECDLSSFVTFYRPLKSVRRRGPSDSSGWNIPSDRASSLFPIWSLFIVSLC